MFKFLKVGLLTIILALSFSVLAVTAEKSDVESIVSYARNAEPGEYGNLDVYRTEAWYQGSEVKVRTLRFKQKTSGGDDFWWTWTLHVARVYYYKGWDKSQFQIIVRYYQDFSSPGAQGFEEWMIGDIDLSGNICELEEARYCARDFVILQCYEDDKNCSNSNWIMLPICPDGYINTDWYRPSLEEWQKKFDEEVNFWLEIIQEKEKYNR